MIMTDNMIQEQLLLAIDDVDDASIMAEAAVMSKIAEVYLRQAMIQETMSEEAFESFFAESTLGEKVDKLGEKIKNFKPLDILVGIWEGIVRVAKTIWANIKKFFGRLSPRYREALVDSKNSALAAVAKKNHCKVDVTQAGWTLMLPFLDFSKFAVEVDKMIKYCESFYKAIDDYSKSYANGGKLPKIKAYNLGKLSNTLSVKNGKGLAYIRYDQLMDQAGGSPSLQQSETNPKVNQYAITNPDDSKGITGQAQKKDYNGKMALLIKSAEKVSKACKALKAKFKKNEVPAEVNAYVEMSKNLLNDITELQSTMVDKVNAAVEIAKKVAEEVLSGKGVDEELEKQYGDRLNSKFAKIRGQAALDMADASDKAAYDATTIKTGGRALDRETQLKRDEKDEKRRSKKGSDPFVNDINI